MTRQTAIAASSVSHENRMRADLYNYLGLLLAKPPDELVLAQTASLTGGNDEMGEAIGALSKVARLSTPQSVEMEFNKLFIGLGRGELLPYASYYLTGFLNEKPLAMLRGDMAAQGLSRSDAVFEPEDNIASLLEIMGALILGRFAAPVDLEQQKTFFNRHIACWAGHFFADLEGAKNAVFYAPVGAIGRLFVDIECEAFRLSGR